MEFRRNQAIRGILTLVPVVLLLGLAEPLHAQQGVFTVSGISVDVTGNSAEAARRQAVEEGHAAAMRRLLERLLPESELGRAPELSAAEIVPLVQDFGVESEKSSAVRYLATMTFRFKPAAVRDLFRLYGLTYAEAQGPRMLVLPVYGRGGSARLWDEPNPWWQTWAARPSDEGLIPLVTPLGDLGDVAAIDAGGALGPDQARLSAIAERYGVEDQLVTQAILSGDPDAGQALLEVVTRRYGSYSEGPYLRRYKQGEGEDLAALLRRAVAGEAGVVEQSWKQANLLEAGLRNRITVSVWAPSLDLWLEIRRALDEVTAVVEAPVRLLTRRVVLMELDYVGADDQLIERLGRNGLVLTNDLGLGWLLYRTGTQPDPAAIELLRAAAAAPVPRYGTPGTGMPGYSVQPPNVPGGRTAPTLAPDGGRRPGSYTVITQ